MLHEFELNMPSCDLACLHKALYNVHVIFVSVEFCAFLLSSILNLSNLTLFHSSHLWALSSLEYVEDLYKLCTCVNFYHPA